MFTRHRRTHSALGSVKSSLRGPRCAAATTALVFALLCCAAWYVFPGPTASAHQTAASLGPAASSLTNPDAACASCHADIYRRYEATSKARSSGVAAEVFGEGRYFNPASGVLYTMQWKQGTPALTYERTALRGRNALSGSEALSYFVGSGKRGRTYLFSRAAGEAKLWYEAPVNWYTHAEGYAMAPAFEEATTAPLALPTDPNCLHCHATGVNTALPQAQHAFTGRPFSQGGVGCSSCHGDATEHLRTRGKAAMLELAKLSPPRRESICLQCHLEGDAVVYRPGKSLAQFKPGEDLADTALYFVNASSPRTLGRAGSQYEGLLRSACRRTSGEKLSCLTCHDPHSTPAASERVAFFRGKCLQCHNAPVFNAAQHHPQQPDCAACHMPSRPTTDISHEQTVNHDIEVYEKDGLPRRGPARSTLLAAKNGGVSAFLKAVDLVPVGPVNASDRDFGLAYAQFAARGNREAFSKAESLLQRAEQTGQADQAANEQIAYLAQLRGDAEKAREAYRRILEHDPANASVLTNTAVLQARAGHLAAAEQALREVIRRNPAEATALLDLAQIEAGSGRRAEAFALTQQALRFNPDDPAANQLLHSLAKEPAVK